MRMSCGIFFGVIHELLMTQKKLRSLDDDMPHDIFNSGVLFYHCFVW